MGLVLLHIVDGCQGMVALHAVAAAAAVAVLHAGLTIQQYICKVASHMLCVSASYGLTTLPLVTVTVVLPAAIAARIPAQCTTKPTQQASCCLGLGAIKPNLLTLTARLAAPARIRRTDSCA
jgi:hypothetical protein